jgi:23S rRNA (guanosine2251-2'-O)-methyltransferase
MTKASPWIAGINAVASSLEHDAEHVREVLIEAGQKNPRLVEIEERARQLDVPVRKVNAQAIGGVAGDLRHQGVVARYEAAKPTSEADLPGLIEAAGGKALLLVLDGVQDPHNLGACLRSAAAALRRQAPRLCGSCTPSSTSSSALPSAASMRPGRSASLVGFAAS